MIANILIPLDGSQLAERALPYAASLGRAAHAKLQLLHVMPDIPAIVRPWTELDVAARLEQLASRLEAEGIRASSRTVAGDATARAVLGAATDLPADLIVMTTHGRSGVGRWLYGSVVDQVLSQSTVPVLVVSSACRDEWPGDRPLKVLVPLDGSALAEAALGPARVLSHTIGAKLLLVRVAEQDSSYAWRFDELGVPIQRPTGEHLQEARDYLEGIADVSAQMSGSVDVLVDVGDPSTSIAALARQEAVDLIVMATHGRSGLARLTMGSVATTALQRAQVPILLIRPHSLEIPGTETGTEPATTATAPTEVGSPIGAR